MLQIILDQAIAFSGAKNGSLMLLRRGDGGYEDQGRPRLLPKWWRHCIKPDRASRESGAGRAARAAAAGIAGIGLSQRQNGAQHAPRCASGQVEEKILGSDLPIARAAKISRRRTWSSS